MKRIFLAHPSYGMIVPGSCQSIVHASVKNQILYKPLSNSILADCFNALWGAAVDNRHNLHLDAFAMIHSDVGAFPGWLDILVEDLYKHDADLMAAVIPIKDESGYVSTTLDIHEDPWMSPRALTLKEVESLPEVFSSEDVNFPLLTNTGCWVARLDRDWCEDTENIFFEIQSRIVRKDGKRVAVSIPEDFGFARKLHAKGLKVMATRRVQIVHYGTTGWKN